MNNKFSSESATKYLNQITQAHLNHEKVYPDQILTFFGIWCFGKKNFETVIKKCKSNKEICIKENDTTISNENLQQVKDDLTSLKKIIDKNQKIEKDTVPFRLQKNYISQNHVFSNIIKSAEENGNINPKTEMMFLSYLYNVKNSYRTLKEIEHTKTEPSFLEKVFHKSRVEIDPIEDSFISNNNYQLKFSPSQKFYSKKDMITEHTSPVCVRISLPNEKDSFSAQPIQDNNTNTLSSNKTESNNTLTEENNSSNMPNNNEEKQFENNNIKPETEYSLQKAKQDINENSPYEEDLNA